MTTKTEERRLVNAWVERDDAQRLEELARRADRSRSAELRLAIRKYLERAGANHAEEEE
jgi:predicted transcriptional regulator